MGPAQTPKTTTITKAVNTPSEYEATPHIQAANKQIK
jgi:hypothetical protein